MAEPFHVGLYELVILNGHFTGQGLAAVSSRAVCADDIICLFLQLFVLPIREDESLLLVPGDPGVHKQVHPGPVELLGGLHSNEDIFSGDLFYGGLAGPRGPSRRGPHLLYILPVPGELAEISGEGLGILGGGRLLTLGRRCPDQSGEVGGLCHLHQLSVLLIYHQDQQAGEGGPRFIVCMQRTVHG